MKTLKTVERGVALLDLKVPGWENRVNLDKLDLSSSCSCVCGQIVTKKAWFLSRYAHGLSLLGIDNSNAGHYGFVAWGRQRYSRLTDEWTRVIRAKRNDEEITS